MSAEKVEAYMEVEEIIKRIEEGENLKFLIPKIAPQQILYVIERISREERIRLIRLLSEEAASKILAKLPSEILEDVILEIGRERLIKITASLPADELSDLLNKLPLYLKRRLLKWLPPYKLYEVKPLLAYPPDTAGGLMTNRIPTFFEGSNVDEVIREFTVRLKFDEYDTSHYIYAVSSDNKLKGVISSRELLLSPRNKKLLEVTVPPSVVVKPTTDQEEVARIVAQYDLIELPVVDGDGTLLGAITVDDVIDVIVNESGEDLLKLAAATKITAPYLTAKITDLVKKRALWLIMLCFVEVFVAFIISRFERVISVAVALSFFIPLISSTGGNSGIQTSTLVVRGLAIGELSLRDLLRILAKESLLSPILGLILSPFFFALSFAITFQLSVSIILAIAIIIDIFVVNFMGGVLPFLTAKIGIDPATISAPLVTTVADAIGLTVYFLVAVLILS